MKKLAPVQVQKLRDLLDQGMTIRATAQAVGCSESTVSNYRRSDPEPEHDPSPELITKEQAEAIARATAFAASIDPGEHAEAAITALQLLQNFDTQGDDDA